MITRIALMAVLFAGSALAIDMPPLTPAEKVRKQQDNAEFEIHEEADRAHLRFLREAIRDSKTNVNEIVEIRDTGTNALAQVEALTFSNPPTRADLNAVRNALVDEMKREKQRDNELLDLTREMLDYLRWQKDHIGDRTPEDSP